MSGHDEVSGEELAARAEKPPQQGGRDAERWIRHYAEGPAREPEIGGVDLDHADGRSREPAAKLARPPGVEFDGENTRSGTDQWGGEGSRSGTDVHHEVAGLNTCCRDDSVSPVVSELMPSPACPPLGGHDAPSP